MKKKVLLACSIIAALALLMLLPAYLEASGSLPYRVFVVQTGSMTPLYPSESAVLVKVRDPHFGEPISFYQHNTVITHRWVGTNADGTLITKGDANETVDPSSLNKADVIGGVVGVVPKLGYWIMYFKNPFGIGSVLCAGCAIWLLWPLLRNNDEVAPRGTVQAT